MGKKITYEYVKSHIESEGYILLTNKSEYINTHIKLSVRCPEGHEYNTTFNHFKNMKQRCPKCLIDSKKHTYIHVEDLIASAGYTLLSDTYINNSTKLLIRCDEGHEYSVTFGCFKQGRRCPICSINSRKHTYDYIKDYIESFGYTLLSDNYKSNKDKLLVRCPEGHEYKAMFNSFKSGQRCIICLGKQKYTYNYVKEFINSTGYELLSDTYKNNHSKLLVRCPENHIYNVGFKSFKQGCRCPMCSNKISKGEKDMSFFIESLGIPIVKNDRTQVINPVTGRNLELDVWIPSMGKAIEYNGGYWHTFDSAMLNDKIKQEQCKQLGIDLLIVKEHNWINNNEFEREIIRRFING